MTMYVICKIWGYLQFCLWKDFSGIFRSIFLRLNLSFEIIFSLKHSFSSKVVKQFILESKKKTKLIKTESVRLAHIRSEMKS